MMTVAEVRAKYPDAYRNLTDEQLQNALIKKAQYEAQQPAQSPGIETSIPTVAEIRSKYPDAYKQFTDEQLEKALAKKYAAMQGGGQSVPPVQEEPFAQKAMNFGKSAINLIPGVDPQSASTQATFGAGDAVRNSLANAANLIPGVNIPEYHSGDQNRFAYKAGEVAGDIGSFLGAGSLATTARLGAQGLPYIGKLGEALAGNTFGKRALRNMAGAAGYEYATSPDEERLTNAGLGGLTSAAIDSVFGVAGKLKPSNLLRGSLSPEELARNLEVTRGTNTDLGSVVGSPGLKKLYENVLQNVPLSGVEKTMQNTAQQVRGQGEDLLGQMLGDSSQTNLKESLHQALKKASKEAYQQKDSLYTQTNELANSIGLKVNRDAFSTVAKDALDQINESSELMREVPSSLINDLQEYTKGNANNLKLSNIFKGKLGDKANNLYMEGKTYEAGIYNRLKNALGQDIEDSIGGSRSPELKQSYQAAQDYYRTNIAPFMEPEITKFTREGADPDLILDTFIKRSQSDRGNLISKLTNKLPEEQQGLPAYGYLSRALEENKLNPQKMKTLYKGLGPNQKEALIKDKALKESLDKYMTLVQMNAEPLSVMANPKTGARNVQALMTMLAGAGAGGLSGFTSPLVGGAIPLAGGAVSNLINKRFFTNENYRNKLVEALIKPDNPSSIGNLVRNIAKPLSFQAWE